MEGYVDLKDFIAETLVQIQEGVEQAIKRRLDTPGASGVINPAFEASKQSDTKDVEFDVAVTVQDKTSGSAKAGLKVFGIDLGGDGSKSAEHSTVSRIKFSVPVIAPTTTVKQGDASSSTS